MSDATTDPGNAGELRLPRMERDHQAAQITFQRTKDEPLRLSFAAASETPVRRWWGTEILSHEPGAVRMDRLTGGAAPLLFNHNWDDPVGMIDGARLEGGRLLVDAHFFDTARAREVAAMVEGGMRNVSIGYELNEVVEDAKANTYTATDWTVYEVSFATVPADPSVGLGRSDDARAKPVRITRTGIESTAAVAAITKEQATMADPTTVADAATPAAPTAAPATLPAQVRSGTDAAEMERARIRGITNLAEANKIDTPVRDMWITGGATFDQVAEDILRIVQERGKHTPKASELGLSKSDAKRFSLLRAIDACAGQNWTKAGFELECSREIAARLNVVPDPNKFYVPAEVQERAVPQAGQRDMTVATANAGGYLVATNNMSFIELLRARSVAYRMGARRLSGLVGNVTVPRQTAAATAYWLANEGTQITESQQTFGQLSLAPKTVGAYTEISRQLMLQSSPDAEGLVTSDLAAVAALAVDVGVLRGSGNSGEPTGITNTGGIGSVTGTSLGYAGVLEFQTDVAAANVVPVRGGYVTTPAIAAVMMQRARFSNTDTPLWVGNIWDGAMSGFAAMSSSQMSSATMLFGDWDQVVVAEWGTLAVEVNPYANFQAGIVGVRAMVSVDVGLRYPAAFSYATSIT